jgi:hypothetical protein
MLANQVFDVRLQNKRSCKNQIRRRKKGGFRHVRSAESSSAISPTQESGVSDRILCGETGVASASKNITERYSYPL